MKKKLNVTNRCIFFLYSLSSVTGNESFDCACFLLKAFSSVNRLALLRSGLFRDLTGPLDLTGLIDLELDLDLEGLLDKVLNLL